MAVFTAIGAGLGALAGATGLLGGASVLGLGATATGALIGGGIGLQAGSAYKAAEGAKDQAAFNQAMAERNQKIAIMNALDVQKKGRTAVYEQRRRVAQDLSSTRAAAAGAGLVVDEAGTTPQQMVTAMTVAGEMDVMRLQNNIEREKRRALIQGQDFELRAGQFAVQRSSINPFRSAVTAGFGAGTWIAPGRSSPPPWRREVTHG